MTAIPQALCWIPYDPASAIALAHDLLTAARPRLGRPVEAWTEALDQVVG